jgi:hypothetical protein
MVEMPDWMTNKSVDVDIDSLDTFGRHVQAELDNNVKENARSVVDRLATPPGAEGGRTFGVDQRYDQAVIIGNYHTEAEIRGRQLLRDFEIGLQAIAWTAMSIANDYRTVDELNSMDLSKISEYFHPKDKSRSLASQVASQPDQPVDYSDGDADPGLIPDPNAYDGGPDPGLIPNRPV